jgi:MFS transporter, PPP family, 3-phenylpropionic acid transporter
VPRPSSESRRDLFAAKLALFYASLFVILGIHLPFFPLWLEAKGLAAREIGLVLAAPMLVRVFAILIATREADRRGVVKATIAVSTLIAALSTGLLGLVGGFWPILLVWTLVTLAFTPAMPLTEAYALKALPARGHAYGPVRLWGSAAFIASSLGAGFLLDVVAPVNLIWFIFAAFISAALVAFTLEPVGAKASGPSADTASPRILLRPAFLAVVAAAGLVQASHAVYYGFSTLDWRAAGLSGQSIGMLWGLGVAAEIALFAVSGRLSPAIGPTLFRWSVMALNPPDLLLPLLQCLHALSFGATHLGALGFLARAAPEHLGATAQGYLAVVNGVLMAGATALAGWLYAAYGGRAYAAMAVLAGLGLVLALAAHRSGGAGEPSRGANS